MDRKSLLIVAVALAAAATACSGSDTDKAGGKETAKPLVLTLEQWDPNYGGAQFADAVAALSDDSIRVELRPELAPSRVDFERAIVEDVRSGKADIGVVATRVWDTLGVSNFEALMAPFLVDSLELQRRVLQSPLAARMLARVEQHGVVGVALLPGPLRRPFGFVRALVGPEDYRGARIGVRPGRVEEATFRSLGASTRVYLTLDGASREGAAFDLTSIVVDNRYRGKTIASNVVFWPRAETVIMNRVAHAALTPAQRQIILRAGRDAVRPRLDEIERAEEEALRTICTQRLASVVAASRADLAGLRAAVRPVYAMLERDERTRSLIAEIRKLADGRDSKTLRCPADAAGVSTAIEGAWTSDVGRDELLASGATPQEADRYDGRGTLELTDGRWTHRDARGNVAGRYTVTGDTVRMTILTCSVNPCTPGANVELGWSVYRDTLTFARVAGRASWARFIAKPMRRVD